MGSFGYWKARKDMIQTINELKNDIPAFLGGLGKAMYRSVKSGQAGELSGDARLDKGLSERMLNDLLGSQSPWAKILLDYGKETIPYLKDHPELIMQIAPMIQQFLGPRGAMGGEKQPLSNTIFHPGLGKE